jgi:protoheme IX farnesyltransferase
MAEIARSASRANFPRLMTSYLEVLKPRETTMLGFIGGSAAIIAAAGYPAIDRLFLALIAIVLGSAGVNGLTNYLDREVDAKMERTRRRALPSRRIQPPEKVLPLLLSLVGIALAIAWWLHPLSFFFGLLGTITAVVWRKTVLCPFLGGISGCSPVLVGWFALNPRADLRLLFLCILLLIWVPLHVWSVMLANREDYLRGGVKYFPLTWESSKAVKLLLGLALVLAAVSVSVYPVADFGGLYLAIAILSGIIMILATVRLVLSGTSEDAWRVYKLSAFPYLGLLFLGMTLDLWITI